METTNTKVYYAVYDNYEEFQYLTLAEALAYVKFTEKGQERNTFLPKVKHTVFKITAEEIILS